MVSESQMRAKIEKELRAELAAEFEEVNALVAEAFELARLEKDLKAKIDDHISRRDAIISKGNQQSELLKKQLDQATLGRETKKQVAGTKAMSSKRIKKETKDETFAAALEAAVDLTDSDGWISQTELIEVADGLLNATYTSQGSIFWKDQISPLKKDKKKVKKEGQSVYIKIK